MQAVGINAHLLFGGDGYRRAGIHHYIEQILTHLPSPQSLRYIIWTGAGVRLPVASGIEVRQSRWPTANPWGRIIWEQSAWPWLAWKMGLSLLHSLAFVTPLFSPVPTLVTVYDLSFLHFPERFPPLKRLYLRTQTRRSCRQARQVVTISESTRRDIQDFLGVPADRITVAPPGVDNHFRPRPPAEVAAFRQRHQLPERFVLHVGTLQPRKNIPTLLEAFSQLDQPGLGLVLVGGLGWDYAPLLQRLEQPDLRGRVHLAGYVPEAELPLWYNAAEALVFPSVYEGFGLPAAQAMACGAPVVAANTSSLPEVVGDAGLLFEPLQVEALIEQLRAVLDHPDHAADLRARGLARAAMFSWENSAATLASLYQKVLTQA